MAKATLLVNGIDIRTQTGVKVIGDMSSMLYAPGRLRGSNFTIPTARGQLGVDLPVDSYTGDVTLQVSGATGAARIANLRSFLSDLRGGTLSSLCTLERQLPKVGGGFDSHTASGQITSNSFALLNTFTGRTSLEIVNLDGAWLDGAEWVLP